MMKSIGVNLFVCFVLLVPRFPLVNGKNGHVTQTVITASPSDIMTSASPSDIVTSFSPVPISMNGGELSSVSSTPTLTDELSSTSIPVLDNTSPSLHMTSSINDVIATSDDVTPSINSSPVSATHIITESVFSVALMSTTSVGVSSIIPTESEDSLVPTRDVESSTTSERIASTSVVDDEVTVQSTISIEMLSDTVDDIIIVSRTTDSLVYTAYVVSSTTSENIDSATYVPMQRSSAMVYSSSDFEFDILTQTSVTPTLVMPDGSETITASIDDDSEIQTASIPPHAVASFESTSLSEANILSTQFSNQTDDDLISATPIAMLSEDLSPHWISLSNSASTSNFDQFESSVVFTSTGLVDLEGLSTNLPSMGLQTSVQSSVPPTMKEQQSIEPTFSIPLDEQTSIQPSPSFTSEGLSRIQATTSSIQEVQSSIGPTPSTSVGLFANSYSTLSLSSPDTRQSVQYTEPGLQSTASIQATTASNDFEATVGSADATETPTSNLYTTFVSSAFMEYDTTSINDMVSSYPSTASFGTYNSANSGLYPSSSSYFSSQEHLTSTLELVVSSVVSMGTSWSFVPSSSPTSSIVTSSIVEDPPSVPVATDYPTKPSTVSNISTGESNNKTDSKLVTRIMITLNGNCKLLRNNIELQQEFLKVWVDGLNESEYFDINEDDVTLEEVSCRPFRVILNVYGNDSSLTSSIENEIIASEFNVRIPDEVRELNFTTTGVEILDDTEVTDGDNADDMAEVGHLETTDYVIIGVASFLFAVLVTILCGLLCRECYIRKRSSSFNLSDMPHINLKLSDFTLTKIPRPKVLYRENSKRKVDRVPVTRVGPMTRQNGRPEVDDHYDKLNIYADNIQVRMRDHAHGLVVGVMCSKQGQGHRVTNGSSISDKSDDSAKKSLLKEDKCIPSAGINNPTFTSEDEVNGNTKFTVQEEEIEHFL